MNSEITPKIVCLGDSLTWGFPYGPRYSWVQLIGERFGLTLVNQGINGNYTEDMLSRFDRDVILLNPTHVIIMGGTNDVIGRESIPRITENLRLMLEIAKNKKIQAILGLPIPIAWQEAEDRLDRIRTWIITYSQERNIPVIPFHQGFYQIKSSDVHNQQTREYCWDLMLDGSHPSKEGYIAMADQVDLDVFRISSAV